MRFASYGRFLVLTSVMLFTELALAGNQHSGQTRQPSSAPSGRQYAVDAGGDNGGATRDIAILDAKTQKSDLDDYDRTVNSFNELQGRPAVRPSGEFSDRARTSGPMDSMPK